MSGNVDTMKVLIQNGSNINAVTLVMIIIVISILKEWIEYDQNFEDLVGVINKESYPICFLNRFNSKNTTLMRK